MRLRFGLTVLATVAALMSGAEAAVLDAQPNGFAIKHTMTVAAPAKRVYAALTDIGKWWSPAHSYSGKAANLSMRARPGGCWCETLKGGGFVEHMRVVYAESGKTLRLHGGLGPLQITGATGHMAWTLEEKDGRTTVTLTYDVGGHLQGGLAAFAAPVDGVLGEALGRFRAYVETGRPTL